MSDHSQQPAAIRKYVNPWSQIPIAQQEWRQAMHERLVIEIGAGQGLHAIRYCQQHQECRYIAIERTQVKFERMLSRHRHHAGLDHLICINTDAVKWISQNIQAQEVDEYFILYPNPYPKKGQANKRWHHMPFMQYLHDTLKDQGQITLATNIESYFKEALAFFTYNDKDYQLKSAGPLAQDFIGRTHFEQKYLARNETCYQIIVSKKV